MNGTDVKVVDASALAAVIFDEPRAGEVAPRLRDTKLAAPELLNFELANICVTKLRRYADERARTLQAFRLMDEFTIAFAHIDYARVVLLAEETGLTGYDASYLWLARHLKAELVTLDRELERAAARIAPSP